MMNKFKKFTGLVAPIDRPNIDTDAIIPKQYLKSIKRTGFGPNLFDDWRYLDPGAPGRNDADRRTNPDFVLNQEPFDKAEILLSRENFGCGSSREHAIWALMDFGFRVVIAPSFADIFYNNSFKNGFLPIALDVDIVDRLFSEVERVHDYRLDIDLENQHVSNPDGVVMEFEIDEFRRHCLLEGLDDIGLTLLHADAIKKFEKPYYEKFPWLEG